MTTHAIETPEGTVTYTDHKRWWWLLSLVNPLIPLVGVLGHWLTGSELWLLVPLGMMFIMGPAFDGLFGEDENNPPEILVPQVEQDTY